MSRPKKYQNPRSPLNGKKYHTGKLCIEGCGRPAGTYWSPLWCQSCNAARMDGISASLEWMIKTMVASKAEGKQCQS